MARIGLTPDQLLVATWGAQTRPTYAARIPAFNVLRGETVALVGDRADAVLDALTDALDACTVIDGAAAAAAGTLRIHAQQAARVGVRALAITDPFVGLDRSARALAVADLAGVAALGLTTVVAVSDAELATSFADRVAVVRDGTVVVAYPVIAPTPRTAGDIEPVNRRVAALLTAAP